MTHLPFQYASATGAINLVDPNLGFVNSVFSKVRGQGHATGLMQNIVSYADARGITLLLTVQAYGSGRILSNQQLVEFYGRFGFQRQNPGWPARMQRDPREKNTPFNET